MERDEILVVDDEPLVALELKERLEALGYAVPALVAYGEDVVAAVARHQPDVVLMDIRLGGGVDGIEAAFQAKAEFDVPVIYLTAYSDAETLRRAARTGPDAFLLKPFDDRELAANIEIALARAKGGESPRRELRGAVSLADALEIPVIIADNEGRVVHANAEASRMLGASASAGLAMAELSGLLGGPRSGTRRDVVSIEPLCRPDGGRYGSLVMLATKDMMEKRLLESSVAEANSMLASLLPGPGAAGPGYLVAGFLEPCLSGSGDFYDVFPLGPGKVGFYGIDVMGHGVIAALMAFALRESLPLVAGAGGGAIPRPSEALRSLYASYSCKSDIRSAFFTISIGSLDTETGEYAVARGGHSPALRLAASGGWEVHYTKGAAVGVMAEAEVEEARGRMGKGDRLVIASDGLLDAFGDEAALDGAIGALAGYCDSFRGRPLGELIESLRAKALSSRGSSFAPDDISVLAIERRG